MKRVVFAKGMNGRLFVFYMLGLPVYEGRSVPGVFFIFSFSFTISFSFSFFGNKAVP